MKFPLTAHLFCVPDCCYDTTDTVGCSEACLSNNECSELANIWRMPPCLWKPPLYTNNEGNGILKIFFFFWQHWYTSFVCFSCRSLRVCLGTHYFLIVLHVEFANTLYLSWVWRSFTLTLHGGQLYLEWQHLLLPLKARILRMTCFLSFYPWWFIFRQ